MKNYQKFLKVSPMDIFTVPSQFYQLWTIFVIIGRHAFIGIHCLMTSKKQELAKIRSLIREKNDLDESGPIRRSRLYIKVIPAL